MNEKTADDLKVVVLMTQDCAHAEADRSPEASAEGDGEREEHKLTLGQAVPKLEQESNGCRPLLMESHMVRRNRRHRFAEPTTDDRIHNMTHDDDMRRYHRDGDMKEERAVDAMRYTWEESDQMFHSLWNERGVA